MLYAELHHRYGNHIAQRVQRELPPDDFRAVAVDGLQEFLDHRAENAHQAYHLCADNPALTGKARDRQDEQLIALYRQWREAEDLAYLVMVAEDVSAHTQALAAGR